MNFTRRIASIVLVLVWLVPVACAKKQTPNPIPTSNWVGERVVCTNSKTIRCERLFGDNTTVSDFFPVPSMKVLKDVDGKLFLQDNVGSCWVEKTHFILFEEAIDYFNKQLSQTPDDPFSLQHLADCLYLKGKNQESKDISDRYLKLYPKTSEAWSVYHNRGRCLLELGDMDLAIDDFKRSVLLRPDNYGVYNAIAYSLFKKGEYDEAMEYISETLKINANNEGALTMRYSIYMKQKEYQMALDDISSLIQRKPRDAGLYYNRACACSLLGNSDQAIRSLEKSFEYGYRKFEHIDKDTDLDAIRKLPEFTKLIDKYKNATN